MEGVHYAQLRAFGAVVERGGFARAASHLGVSPSALSQTIRRLEDRLGVRLLNRTTRSVAPSAAGADLLARIGPLMSSLDLAVNRTVAGAGSAAGPLRINSMRLAAIDVLAPRISDFLSLHPGIVLDLVVEDRLVDIVGGGFDGGVRLGERLQKDMIAVPLSGPLRMRVVGSPGYLAQKGYPGHPADLVDHACINFRNPTEQSLYRWEFERGAENLNVSVDGALVANDPEVVMHAAEGGCGLAYLFEHQVRQAIDAGRLVSLLDDWTPPFPGFFLYHPGRRQMPPALRAFIDFFRHA